MATEQKTIYLVTTGSYSDYGIDAAFSTKDLAQEFIDRLGDLGGPRIEEWVLDDLLPDIRDPRPIWDVAMERDGTTRYVREMPLDAYNLRLRSTNPWTMQEHSNGKLVKTYLRGYFRAEDEQHAVKIMNEHRARWVAEGHI